MRADPADTIGGLRVLRNLHRALEDDLTATFRYVEPVRDNLSTYSIEFMRLLQSACAGIESTFSLWYSYATREGAETELRRKSVGERNLPDYFPLLERLAIETDQDLILLRDPSEPVCPFLDWREPKTVPGWWTAHNKTKHQLDRTWFKQANLRNAINAVGGLYLALNDLGTRRTHPVGTSVFKPLY